MREPKQTSVVQSLVARTGAVALSLALSLPAGAQGMTAAPAQQRKADPNPAVGQPGTDRMRSPADQEPYGYPSSTGNPIGTMGNSGAASASGNGPATMPDAGAGTESNANSRSGVANSIQQQNASNGEARDRGGNGADWLGLLGLLGLAGLFALRRRTADTDSHGVYRERGRAA